MSRFAPLKVTYKDVGNAEEMSGTFPVTYKDVTTFVGRHEQGE